MYFIAAIVVLFNVDEHGIHEFLSYCFGLFPKVNFPLLGQRFYLGHTGEIKWLWIDTFFPIINL